MYRQNTLNLLQLRSYTKSKFITTLSGQEASIKPSKDAIQKTGIKIFHCYNHIRILKWWGVTIAILLLWTNFRERNINSFFIYIYRYWLCNGNSSLVLNSIAVSYFYILTADVWLINCWRIVLDSLLFFNLTFLKIHTCSLYTYIVS